MKKNIIRIITGIMLIATFVIIFGFSSQDSKQSGGLSKKVTNYVVDAIPTMKDMQLKEKDDIIDRLESVIRKLAHFSIYTLVGLLLMILVSTYNLKELDKIATSLIVGIIYASSDEIHQAFIPGRSAQITDVIIDMMGVCLGIFLVLLIIEIYIQKRKKKDTHINIKYL